MLGTSIIKKMQSEMQFREIILQYPANCVLKLQFGVPATEHMEMENTRCFLRLFLRFEIWKPITKIHLSLSKFGT